MQSTLQHCSDDRDDSEPHEWEAPSVFDDLGCEQEQPTPTELIRLSNDMDIEVEATSVAVWGSARLLAAWLLTEDGRGVVAGRSILELGAALGLPSIACAVAGARHVVATDRCQGALGALERLRSLRYAGADWAQRLEVRELDWAACASASFQPEARADVVIAADCHYYTAALRPLLAAIVQHVQPSGTLVLASREGRISLDESREMLVRAGFLELHKVFFEDDHTASVYRAPESASGGALDVAALLRAAEGSTDSTSAPPATDDQTQER
mmetsp:Transcript_1688/g.5421  ORF Transcript_1688/g.5421 Transcript_1688/m.5421 type:complete len:270 (+) Transcript_1688:154-963(+)